ncbi:hypothetical protein [Halorubrum ezzemoulense]|uniref:Uncharacterized protein n=1 Tax=Halorubrum ezzemoulense TaxID=337243 RepID=A0A256J5Z2_HALEZ|nr:hypothetical protein [Halorubrum ezzemoulense]OYR64123.1 hypothetical protein DJ80_06085 [Halorubrum ezzemoulense]
MTDGYHLVREWSDIAAATKPSGRDKQRVATLLEEGRNCVVWVPTWLLDAEDNDIATVEASEHLAVGGVEDYSEKAWSFTQSTTDGSAVFLPKSAVVLFERGEGVESIETPQRGLASFEEAQSDD